MKKISALLVPPLLCISSSALAYVPLKKEGYFWKNGYYDVHLNPENIPSWIGKNDSRMAGPLTPEAQKEIRTQIFEDLIREYAREWSKIPLSTLIIRYMGRTDASCGILHQVYDQKSVTCWKPATDMVNPTYSGLTVPWSIPNDVKIMDGKPVYSFTISEVEILLNAEASIQNILGGIWGHELGHSVGLGHEDTVPSLMSRGALAKGITKPQQDDFEGIQYMYPFKQECAPEITSVDGQLRFTAHMYIDGQESVQVLETEGNSLRVIAEDKNPQLTQSCALKPDMYGIIGIPYIKLDGQLYWLVLKMVEDTYEIVSYGPVQ